VLEEGKPVSSFSLIPASQSAAPNEFGIVLLIDASASMRGEPIQGAVAAARVFADGRNANQRLGIVTFNDQSRVLVSLTSDAPTIDAALAEPPVLDPNTHLYDGVQRALELLTTAKVRSGSIVVLSDGADVGSQATLTDVAAAAQADHVKIFTVGLRSRAFRGAPLKALAAQTGGSYSEASSATKDLPAIYSGIATRLANEYVVRYRSLSGPGESVQVEVKSAEFKGTAAATYTSPRLSEPSRQPFHRSLGWRVWQSGIAMLAVSAIAAALLAFALLALLKPHGRSVRDRLAEFVSLAVREERDDGSALPDKVFAGAERSLGGLRWWPVFKQKLELAQIRMPAVQIVLWTLVGTLLLMFLLYLLTGAAIVSVLALGIPLAVNGFIQRRADGVRKRFAEQLPDNLQVLASALRAGHSLVGALSVVVDDSPEPSRGEFRRVIADEQLGVPLEEALNVVAQRMDNRDLEQVALVAALQRRTGGNTAEVLDRVTETIRERFELRRLIKTLTAQGRMSRWIVSFLPLALLCAILAINPKYVEPLFTHGSGRILLVVATVMVVSGSLVIRRIVNIKV
jgi:tight adherence protein B